MTLYLDERILRRGDEVLPVLVDAQRRDAAVTPENQVTNLIGVVGLPIGKLKRYWPFRVLRIKIDNCGLTIEAYQSIFFHGSGLRNKLVRFSIVGIYLGYLK